MQHIVQRTPRRDKDRVLDFLSQFAPMEFVMGELGSHAPQPECASPVVFLARFRDNIYIFLINMPDALAEVVQPVVFQLLRSMYRVPLKWEVHGATVQWCEAAIPNTRDLRPLRKGVVLDLNCFSVHEAEWARWLPAPAPNSGPVMQAQVPSILQKSLWFALQWRDVYANIRSFLWGLGVLGYSHRWWKPPLDRFFTQHALRSRFPEAVIESWYKEGRVHASGHVHGSGGERLPWLEHGVVMGVSALAPYKYGPALGIAYSVSGVGWMSGHGECVGTLLLVDCGGDYMERGVLSAPPQQTETFCLYEHTASCSWGGGTAGSASPRREGWLDRLLFLSGGMLFFCHLPAWRLLRAGCAPCGEHVVREGVVQPAPWTRVTLFCGIFGLLICSSGGLPALGAFAGLLCASPTDQLYDTSGMVRHQLM